MGTTISVGRDAVVSNLAAALAAKGPDYVPRTKHVENGRPLYTNRLIHETSPYLLQHAHNPVNWYPWGAEAFDEAKRLGRPVFLSVGYATCHWCHVMEEESFEDGEIAAFLNEHYVCIKVDREERPDVDAVYMSALQRLKGGGGWPMSVWLTPAREPFYAGTYFPPRDGVRGVQRGFLSMLRDIADTFVNEPAHVNEAAVALVEAVKQSMEGQSPAKRGKLPSAKAITNTVDYVRRAFDPEHGGLRRVPKFPSNLPVRLLLRYHRRTRDERFLKMATLTLEKMAAGGIYDQLGGGFHRYSTDGVWLVPHFEKMLYDNALLVVSYVEAFAQTKRRDFERVAREVLDYVLREMTAPEGGFYSATDADSEGEEGRFFVWSLSEIEAALGADAAAFCAHYGVTAAGNFEGHNILSVPFPNEDTWAALAPARAKLYEIRQRRVPPLRDEKVLAAWNGLMLSAFAVAGRVFDEPRYVEAASRAASFLLSNLWQNERIVRSYKDGRHQPQGFLEDQSFVTAGLLDLFEASQEPRWLQAALQVANATQTLFGDQQRGGWFATAHDGEALLARERPRYDGAEPSGTSVALLNALRLSTFTGDDTWRRVADAAFEELQDTLESSGPAMTEALVALDYRLDTPREVLVVWPAGKRAAAQEMLNECRRMFLPNRAFVFAEEGPELAALAAVVPFATGKACINGQATAYVCEQGRCELPVTTALELRATLAKAAPLP
ncbi:MAG: thioredoxin domain-containing protein [Deltaproteobacteria bacterium]|nr:thioredoxin domain-containing protein [Deltaproteobacteria bacterium]